MSENPESDFITQIEADEHASTAVLRAIAAVSNQSILELSPLAESVEVDSFDRLFASSNPPESLRFHYEGYEVSVEPGRVCIRQART